MPGWRKAREEECKTYCIFHIVIVGEIHNTHCASCKSQKAIFSSELKLLIQPIQMASQIYQHLSLALSNLQPTARQIINPPLPSRKTCAKHTSPALRMWSCINSHNDFRGTSPSH
jgi:hypothetical protein